MLFFLTLQKFGQKDQVEALSQPRDQKRWPGSSLQPWDCGFGLGSEQAGGKQHRDGSEQNPAVSKVSQLLPMFGKRRKFIPPPLLFNSSGCYLPVLLNLGEIQGWFLDVLSAWKPFLVPETVSLNYMIILAWPACVCTRIPVCASMHPCVCACTHVCVCVHVHTQLCSNATFLTQPPSQPFTRFPFCFLRTCREHGRLLTSRTFYLQSYIRITYTNENHLQALTR